MKAILIGLGNIGMGYDLKAPGLVQTHAKALAMFGFDVTAVDPNFQLRAIAEEQYGFKTVSSLESLQIQGGIDVVIVASPTEHHKFDIQWAIKQQPKVILIEKPLVDQVHDLMPLVEELKTSGLTVLVNVIRNYDRLTQRLMMALKSSKSAKIEITYSKSLRHNGIHFLALLQKHFGDPVAYTIHKKDFSLPKLDVTYKKVKASFSPNSLSDNTMVLNTENWQASFLKGGRQVVYHSPSDRDFVFDNRLQNYQESVMDKVVDCIAGKPDDSFECAWRAQRLIEQVMQECTQ